MRQSVSRFPAILSGFLSMVLGACGDDAGVGGGGGNAGLNVTGGVEKGPLVLGSSVAISPLDGSLNPTGDVFNTQTTSDAGVFSVAVAGPGLASLEATGFQFNELAGSLSLAPITLRGLADLDGATPVFVNVITHMEERRVRALVLGGASLADAITQAELELQAALQVASPGVWQSTSAVEMTVLGGDDDANAYLLAVSAVMLQAATTSAGGPDGSVDGELQQLLNQLAQDLEDDGLLEGNLVDALLAAQLALDTGPVKQNLADRIAELGSGEVVPDIDRILDQDHDGLLNVDDNCPRVANPDQLDSDLDGVGDACGEPAVCGDGVAEGDEECDDGNRVDDDGCTTTCKAPGCGDGILDPDTEECDDGNDIDGDGCSACFRIYDLVAAGDRTCVVLQKKQAMRLKCWGDNTFGALGLGDTEARGDDPGEIEALQPIDIGFPDDLGASVVSLLPSSTCMAIVGTGLKCWGRNDRGQLGLGDTEARGDEPGEMGSNLPFTSASPTMTQTIPAGLGFCAYDQQSGQWRCWGGNDNGMLGNGPGPDVGDDASEVPITSRPLVSMWESTGGRHGIGRNGNEMIATWGLNDEGQLGLGNTEPWGDDAGETVALAPEIMPFTNTPYAAGRAHTCVGGSSVRCWGANGRGQLGLGHTNNIGDQPGEMTALTGFGMAGVALLHSSGDADFTCATRDVAPQRSAACWGANESGQLGRGDSDDIGDDANELLGLANIDLGTDFAVSKVAVGRAHACALSIPAVVGEPPRIKCWGDNSKGQLGLGDTENRGDDPNEMGDDLPFVAVN